MKDKFSAKLVEHGVSWCLFARLFGVKERKEESELRTYVVLADSGTSEAGVCGYETESVSHGLHSAVRCVGIVKGLAHTAGAGNGCSRALHVYS